MSKHLNAFRIAAASMLLASFGAHAELPAAISGLGTTLTGYVNDTFTMVVPVVALSIGLGLLIKIVKRLSNKV